VSERRWDLLRHGYAANSGLHVACQLVGDGPFTAHVGAGEGERAVCAGAVNVG
jgi:hypothetical protein